MQINRRTSLCFLAAHTIGWQELSWAKDGTMYFSNAETVRSGRIVNDGVMGGVSQSSLRLNPEGMFFEGTVSLENNGGFASMRFPARFPQETTSLELVVRGGSRRYKLILRTKIAPQVIYQSDFLGDAPHTKIKMNKAQFKILFVCMGNICRSPTAEAVFCKKLAERHLLQKIVIDSAGTHNFHLDSPPDERSQAHARKRGYDMSHLRARPVVDSDFEEFDLLLTMDWDNRALLGERCPAQYLYKVRGLSEFLLTTQAPVIPDPYYGGYQEFEHVLDLIEEASEGLMEFIIQKAQA